MRNPISVLRFQLIPDLQIKTGVKELSSWARLAQQVTMRGEEGTICLPLAQCRAGLGLSPREQKLLKEIQPFV